MKIQKIQFLLWIMALLFVAVALKIGQITGSGILSFNVTGTNASLSIWDDTDLVELSQGEIVSFYANYSNFSGSPIDPLQNANCTIRFDDSEANMSYDAGTSLYFFSRTFPLPADYSWNVTCMSGLYETLVGNDAARINKTYCERTVSGNITLTSDLLMTNGSACAFDGLRINASNVDIDCGNFAIQGSNSGYGIMLDSVDGGSIVGCGISGFSQGIYISSSDNNIVRNNSFTNNNKGIYLIGSVGNIFYYNNFSQNAVHAYSSNPANQFNTTISGKPIGNFWDEVSGLAIFDSDADGYGDFGQQYPYNSTNGGKVANVTDWGPVSSALDLDNDGSPSTIDCDDSDPTMIAPRNDILITKNSTLCPGNYNLNDTLYDGIIRFGASNLVLSCNNAVLIGNDGGKGIYSSYPNITLKDCNVSHYTYGIYLDRANGSVIKDTSATDNDYSGITLLNSSDCNVTDVTLVGSPNIGIYLSSSQGNNLTGITARDNNVGIHLDFSDNNKVYYSNTFNNTEGIRLDHSNDNTMIGVRNYGNLRGIHLEYSATNNLTNVSIYDNTEVGLLIYFSDANIFFNSSSYGNTGSGILLDTARDNRIQNSTISSNRKYGIESYISLYSKVYNSTIFNNTDAGIFINASNNNSIVSNNISSNRIGLYLSGSNFASVQLNKIKYNTREGMLVDPSYDAVFENNTIVGNTGNGINISDNSKVSIFNNTISDNSLNGIWLRDNNLWNITNNTISSNSRYGIFFVNSTLSSFQDLFGINSVSTSNTLGMLSFNWYVQVHSFDRYGNNESNVSINLTRNDSIQPELMTNTSGSSITSVLIATEYVVNNLAQRGNKTYNITALKGDFIGTKLVNVTENLIASEADEVDITLDTALPPHVILVTPNANISSTNHNPSFVCNASHEGGLSNISLYTNHTGIWSAVIVNNVTGIQNETTFSLAVSDSYFIWTCMAFGLYNNSGFALENLTFNAYTVTGGGGGGGGVSSPPAAPAPSPAPAPAPAPAPSPPAPSPGSPPQSIAPAIASVLTGVQTAASVSCNENISIVEEKLSTEEILKVVKIPEGYIVAAKPFKASCKGGESFKMGIMIPDNLEDVQALKCSGASCSSKTTSVATKLCPGKQVETYRSENVLNMSTVQARILPVQANLTGENNSLASGNFSVSFGGDVEASISMPSENQPEPVNKNVKIVGTPMVVRFNKESGADLVNVTMPYVLKSDEDESSVAVYAKRVDNNGSRWIYVGGRLDIIKKIVSAEVNLSLYAKDGEVTLAPITSFCPECTAGAEFVNPFTPDPDSRQAIILLHGLWGMGKVWEGLITSFRLTNQPYQLWTFSYLVNKPAQETARDLANYLEANQYRYDKIYIIGYSLGGLVSQSALRYAYEQNQINPQAYTFIGKVKKVLVVATPNAGSPVVKYLDTFISEYLNAESTSVVPINEQNKELLDKGIILEPVPNISYYAIAGTKSYDFMESLGLTRLLFGSELNDGLVGVTSVQRHGSGYLNESCVNYWSRPVVHTLIINDPLAQKIMGQIIASDMFKEMAAENIQTNLFGYSNYFELDIEQCSPGDLYVLVGKEKNISDIERAAYCACGNKVCDGLEDALTCPADCLVVEKPLMTRIIENSLTILALLIVLFMIGGFGYVLFEHYLKKKEPPELPPGFNLSKPISMERVKYLKVSITNLRNGLKTIRKRRALLRKSPPSATETVLLTEKEAALTKEEDMIESKIREYEEELEKESESVKDKTSASKKKGRGSRDKEQALNTKSISDIFDKGV